MGLLGTYPYHTLALLVLSYAFFRQWKEKGRNRNPKSLPLPPGPKGYPLIGNLFDMPASKPWILYDAWCKTYGEPLNATAYACCLRLSILGDMVYFNVFGQGFLVLGSRKRTTDLLERRSSNYSDRIRMPMLELYVSRSVHP